jgi:hypothetical protein
MAPQEAVVPRGVGILLMVSMGMMMAMMGCPPQRATLHSAGTEHGKDQLTEARRLEGAVREITVVEASDGEHADGIQQDSRCHGHLTPADPEHAKTHQVHGNKGEHAQPICPSGVGRVVVIYACPGIEPTGKANQGGAFCFHYELTLFVWCNTLKLSE